MHKSLQMLYSKRLNRVNLLLCKVSLLLGLNKKTNKHTCNVFANEYMLVRINIAKMFNEISTENTENTYIYVLCKRLR